MNQVVNLGKEKLNKSAEGREQDELEQALAES